MEAVFTVVGMPWAPFGLNIWLIANASASFTSFELMVGFYKYGYAMPFYHCVSISDVVLGRCDIVVNIIRIRRANNQDPDSSYQVYRVWHKNSFWSQLWRSCFVDGTRLVWYVSEYSMAYHNGEKDWYPSSTIDTSRIRRKERDTMCFVML